MTQEQSLLFGFHFLRVGAGLMIKTDDVQQAVDAEPQKEMVEFDPLRIRLLFKRVPRNVYLTGQPIAGVGGGTRRS